MGKLTVDEIKACRNEWFWAIRSGSVYQVLFQDDARQTPRYGVKKPTQVYLRCRGTSPAVFTGPFYATEAEAQAVLAKRLASRAAAAERRAAQPAPALRVIEREDGNYDVVSGTNTYHVTGRAPEFGNEDLYVWSCDCPAGQHGRNCKHLDAVLAILN